MKHAVIVHGWGGSPEEPLHQWLKEQLEARGYTVVVPEMPETETPAIETWVPAVRAVVETGPETILIGHSIGCQTILRYLAELPAGELIDRCIFIAPWLHANRDAIAEEGEGSLAVLEQWESTSFDRAAVKAHIIHGTFAIFSDSDPFVPISEEEIFEKELGARTMVLHDKGHFTEDDGVEELPEVLGYLV